MMKYLRADMEEKEREKNCSFLKRKDIEPQTLETNCLVYFSSPEANPTKLVLLVNLIVNYSMFPFSASKLGHCMAHRLFLYNATNSQA